jgi:hypothetical protein
VDPKHIATLFANERSARSHKGKNISIGHSGKKYILKNVVTVARVGDSGNLRQNFMRQNAPNTL